MLTSRNRKIVTIFLVIKSLLPSLQFAINHIFFIVSISSFTNADAFNISMIGFATIIDLLSFVCHHLKSFGTLTRKEFFIQSCFVDIRHSTAGLLSAAYSVTRGFFLGPFPIKKIKYCGTLVYFGADFARSLQNNAASNGGRDHTKCFRMVKSICHFMRKI